MGQQLKKKKHLTELEKMLSETYKNTELTFANKEITQLNLRIKDARNYFNTASFTYYLYFNQAFFQDWLNILYENYNHKIESFSSSSPFFLLVDFDDDEDEDESVDKTDYEPLFTIVFEKLEIDILTFFFLTNYNPHSTAEFFSQLFENCYLFQLNRKFDSFCFLLSNTDYFIKDNNNIIYFGIKQLNNTDMHHVYKTEHLPKMINDYMKGLYHNYYFETFLSTKHLKSICFSYFKDNIMKQISPFYIKWTMCLDVSLETSLFVKSNTVLFEMIDALMTASSIILLSVKLCNIDTIQDNPNFELFLKNLLTAFDQRTFKFSTLVVKVYYEVKEMQMQMQDNNTDIGLSEIEEINAIIRNMINESFAYRYNNSINNKRKLIIEMYKVQFNRREKPTDNVSIEDVKLMDVYDCYYYKETFWYYWFIDPKERRQRNWNAIYILFTKQLNQIGKIKSVSLLIDKYLTIEHKYNSTISKTRGKSKESEFLYSFYS